MREVLKRLVPLHKFVPRTFNVLLSPNHETVQPIHEKEEEIVAHFSQYAKVFSFHREGAGSVTLLIRSSHNALKLAINGLNNEIIVGHEEVKRTKRHEGFYILAQ